MTDHPEPHENDVSDEALLAQLRATAGRVDPLPPRLETAARAALSWRTIDAELAELTHDTLLDDNSLAVVRHGDTPRLLTFEGSELSAEVEALEVGEGRRLTGQLVPPQSGEVEVTHSGGQVRVDANEVGCFVADDLRRGPIRLRYRALGGDGWTFETPWVVI